MTALLPLFTRVTHFDGGRGTHGKGTIIRYNGIRPNAYMQERPQEATEIAAKAGLVGMLISSAYDNVRCPYVVRWDYRQDFFDRFPDCKEKHPHGYTDVYERDSIKALPEQIFKKGDKLKVVRALDEDDEPFTNKIKFGTIATMADRTSETRDFIIVDLEDGSQFQLQKNCFELYDEASEVKLNN